jgi:hypothetical protein
MLSRPRTLAEYGPPPRPGWERPVRFTLPHPAPRPPNAAKSLSGARAELRPDCSYFDINVPQRSSQPGARRPVHAVMSEHSERKTGNEPVSGTDPGGTRPAPPAADKDRRPPVESGDQNDPGVPAGTRP